MEAMNNKQENKIDKRVEFLPQIYKQLKKTSIQIVESANKLYYTLVKNFSKAQQLFLSVNLQIKNQFFYLEVSGKLTTSQSWQQNHQVLRKMNNEFGVKGFTIYWSNEKKSYVVKSHIQFQCQFLSSSNQATEYILKTIQQMIKAVQKCFKQACLMCKVKLNVKNQCKKLDKLIYQIEQIRRGRDNHRTNLNFNQYSFKNFQEFQEIYKSLGRDGLKKYFKKDEFNKQQKKQIQKVYQQLQKKFISRDQQQINKLKIKRQPIFMPLKIKEQRVISDSQIFGSFKQIVEVQLNYRVQFSFNLVTLQLINQISGQDKNQTILQQKTNIFIKKFKSNDQSDYGVTQNKIFQNQKAGLFLLSKSYHNSISHYYVPCFNKIQQINELYSVKHPESPIKKFLLRSNDLSNSYRFLQKIKQIFKFIQQVAQGINVLFQTNIIHRDLKPANILIGSQGKAKIIDFGSCCPHRLADPLQQNIAQLFEYSLRSTNGYFYRYQNLSASVALKFSFSTYNTHENFDIYSLGAITQKLIPSQIQNRNQLYQTLKNYINYFIRKCQCSNPDDRLTPIQSCIVAHQIRVLIEQLIKQHQIYQ